MLHVGFTRKTKTRLLVGFLYTHRVFTYFFHRPWQRRGERFARSCLSFIAMHARTTGGSRCTTSSQIDSQPNATRNYQKPFFPKRNWCLGTTFFTFAAKRSRTTRIPASRMLLGLFRFACLLFIWHIRKTC